MVNQVLIDSAVAWILCILVLKSIPFWCKVPTTGLPLAYVGNLALNHFFGALIYALPWFEGIEPAASVEGFLQSTYGIASFVLGNLTAVFFIKFLRPQWIRGKASMPNPDFPKACMVTGLIFFLGVEPFVKNIPSISTFFSIGIPLFITGVCLSAWKAWCSRGKKIMRFIVLALCFPFITIAKEGFLGYGTAGLMICLIFVGSFYRPKWRVWAVTILAVYMGLSVFVTYSRDRDKIREVLWYQTPTLHDRINQLTNTFSNFELLDIFNQDQLSRIDARLNQNWLVGRSVEYITEGNQKYAQGETITDAMLAMIPRILWPDKPVRAGGNALVSQYTGIEFAEGTSVGIGQVMEFYINFGVIGVVVGFFVLGALIAIFDVTAGYRLKGGGWTGFAYWFLSAFGFLQAGGSLVEISATVTTSIIFCIFLDKFALSKYGNKIFSFRLNK